MFYRSTSRMQWNPSCPNSSCSSRSCSTLPFRKSLHSNITSKSPKQNSSLRFIDRMRPLMRLRNIRTQYSIFLGLERCLREAIMALREGKPLPKYSLVLFLSSCRETMRLSSLEKISSPVSLRIGLEATKNAEKRGLRMRKVRRCRGETVESLLYGSSVSSSLIILVWTSLMFFRLGVQVQTAEKYPGVTNLLSTSRQLKQTNSFSLKGGISLADTTSQSSPSLLVDLGTAIFEKLIVRKGQQPNPSISVTNLRSLTYILSFCLTKPFVRTSLISEALQKIDLARVFFSMCSRYFLKRNWLVSSSQIQRGAQYLMRMSPSGSEQQRETVWRVSLTQNLWMQYWLLRMELYQLPTSKICLQSFWMLSYLRKTKMFFVDRLPAFSLKFFRVFTQVGLVRFCNSLQGYTFTGDGLWVLGWTRGSSRLLSLPSAVCISTSLTSTSLPLTKSSSSIRQCFCLCLMGSDFMNSSSLCLISLMLSPKEGCRSLSWPLKSLLWWRGRRILNMYLWMFGFSDPFRLLARITQELLLILESPTPRLSNLGSRLQRLLLNLLLCSVWQREWVLGCRLNRSSLKYFSFCGLSVCERGRIKSLSSLIRWGESSCRQASWSSLINLELSQLAQRSALSTWSISLQLQRLILPGLVRLASAATLPQKSSSISCWCFMSLQARLMGKLNSSQMQGIRLYLKSWAFLTVQQWCRKKGSQELEKTTQRWRRDFFRNWQSVSNFYSRQLLPWMRAGSEGEKVRQWQVKPRMHSAACRLLLRRSPSWLQTNYRSSSLRSCERSRRVSCDLSLLTHSS